MRLTKYIICVILLALTNINCRTVAILWEPNEDGIMIMKEKMELRGVGQNEASFKDKKIKNDSGFSIKMPDINLDIDKLGN